MAVKPLPLLERLNIQVNVVSVLMYFTHTGQLSTESQFEELKNELKSIMSNLNDTMAEIQTIKRLNTVSILQNFSVIKIYT